MKIKSSTRIQIKIMIYHLQVLHNQVTAPNHNNNKKNKYPPTRIINLLKPNNKLLKTMKYKNDQFNLIFSFVLILFLLCV